MRDDTHGYVRGYGWRPEPVKPFDVIERVRDADGIGQRSDTRTSSLSYAMRRRDELRRSGRPAFVLDHYGRRVEVERF